jgi:hypothetical protein
MLLTLVQLPCHLPFFQVDIVPLNTNLFLENDADQEMASYGATETANIWMADEVHQRYGASGLHALSVHLCVIPQEIARHLPEASLQGILA